MARLTSLRASDEPVLRVWCRDFLVGHLRLWCDKAGLDWTDQQIDGHIVGHGLVERDLRRLREAAQKYESNLMAVARDGERPVGAIWAETTLDPFLGMRLGVIAWIYVDPAHRGERIGAMLVEGAKGWMRARSLDLVQLHVISDNVAAVRLYESAGLRRVDLRMLGRLDA